MTHVLGRHPITEPQPQPPPHLFDRDCPTSWEGLQGWVEGSHPGGRPAVYLPPSPTSLLVPLWGRGAPQHLL